MRESAGAADRGFTLMEVIIVLAVMAALAAAITPMALGYLLDAKKTQAQNDVNQIAQAVGKFYQDTALPPYKNNTSTTKIAGKESADFDCLYGPGSAPIAATDPTGTWTGGAGVNCLAASTTRDTIQNFLIANTPGASATKNYVTTGKNAWRGPYLPSVPVDPWGNPYLINIGKADPSAATQKAVWVISAGPNGNFETNADLAATSALSASGDDIVARVK
jgi:prepilin-type N-terminal cleavage/methylation domain-containing protein